MVTLRSTAKEEQTQQLETQGKDGQGGDISEYELSREERIKENRERMQKLGILTLSQKLMAPKSVQKRAYCRRTDLESSPLPDSGIVRRSSRLQNSTPVTYCELDMRKRSFNEYNLLGEEGSEDVKKGKSGAGYRKLLREGGPKPEIYTEEHEKLLGSTERNWTLFVDGYGNDGKRIYDPIMGKTCHQCRQKTLGHHTCCTKCNFLRGQFCGDCLYMRYGEHVLEANENPNWICPCCRDICNCSFCRQAKGWPPTGTLYKKVSRLGYKSVAHYLVQTRRHVMDSDKSGGTKVPVSAKRSLPFSDAELTIEEGYLSESNVADPPPVSGKEFPTQGMPPEGGAEPLQEPAIAIQLNDQTEYQLSRDHNKIAAESNKDQEGNFGGAEPLQEPAIAEYQLNRDHNKIAAESYKDQEGNFGGAEPLQEPAIATQLNDQAGYELSPDRNKIAAKSNKDKEGNFLVDLFLGSGYETTETKTEKTNASDNKDVVVPETSLQSLKKRVRVEPSSDSIAGRLRQRRPLKLSN